MYELSLFSGAGGGLLGTHLLGWQPVGYVEFNDYCQRVIKQRIIDGILPVAPIFGDVQTFISEGFAASYTGMVDVITAGFPCQPFSEAGKRRGADDERNMWPATIATIRVVRPKLCLLENVPGLLSSGYFGTILGDLAESGYDARWRILSAAEMGAPHKRDRLWIVAFSNCIRIKRDKQNGSRVDKKSCVQKVNRERPYCARVFVGANISHRKQHTNEDEPLANAASHSRDIPYRMEGFRRKGEAEQAGLGSGGKRCPIGWWDSEPDMGRVADGVAARVDRLKAIGNGQVPAVVAAVWRLLTE
jgi:DNA (cytosine-5)-methyltransferase 1